MAGFKVGMDIEGVPGLEKYVERVSKEMHGGKIIKSAFQFGANAVQKDARSFAPVDTGELRASIMTKIEQESDGIVATVFSDAPQAGPMETSSDKRWFPPPAALQGWAVRHGFPEKGGAFLVARAIFRKGLMGGKGIFYMKRALEKNEKRVFARIVQGVERVLKGR